MKHEDADHREAVGPGERLDAIVDEALREIAAPPPVNLKPRVMAAWDAARQRADVARPAAGNRPGAWTGWGLLRPAATLAALLLLVAASLLVWQQVGWPPQGTDRAGSASPSIPAAKPPAGEAISPGPSIGEPPGPALAESASPPATSAASRSARRAPRRLVDVEFPVEHVAASLDYLPGAPAGELGRGVSPLPETPPIVMMPVQPAPTVSEMSRPVSEFPAGEGSQPPGSTTDPGQSGGPRR